MDIKIKNNLLSMMAVSALAFAASCTSETEIPVPSQNAGTDPYSVRFSICGSAGATETRAGATAAPNHTAEESKVTRLVALVFSDTDRGASTGSVNEADDNDPFVKKVNILEENNETELTSKEYDFYLDKAGVYNVCFVANPDDDLDEKLGNLSKYSDLKKLEVTQQPDTKPGMLMTSSSVGVKIDGKSGTSLGKVRLTRIMSRLDIYNEAQEVIISKVSFNNRTVKSLLYNDRGSFNEEYRDKTETGDYKTDYEFKDEYYAATDADETIGMTGAPIPGAKNKSEGLIYSYEQFGTEEFAPSLTVTYTVSSKESEGDKTATVEFKDAENNPLPIKRNTLYRLHVRQIDGKLNFNLTVADWNEGEEFNMADGLAIKDNWNVDEAIKTLRDKYIGDGNPGEYGDLALKIINDNLKTKTKENAKVGDIFCQDGTLFDADALIVVKEQYDFIKTGIEGDIRKMQLPDAASKELTRKANEELINPIKERYDEALAKSVGIVAYLFKAGETRYATQLGKNFTGLVLAKSEANDNKEIALCKADNSSSNIGTKSESYAASYESTDGYDRTIAACAKANAKTNYPGYYAARNYGEAPVGTTGWYIGTNGEMLDIFKKLGNISDDDFTKIKNGSRISSSSIVESINSFVGKIPQSLLFKSESDRPGKYSIIWTSSYTNDSQNINISFWSQLFFIEQHPRSVSTQMHVRPILTF